MNKVRPYLEKVGKFTVEQVPCPTHFPESIDWNAPRAGVLHTTEGPRIEDALGVFRQHFAPHFLVGPGRVLQLVQVGLIGAALVHNNARAIVQVEMVGYSKQTHWFPDDATAEVLGALMAACKVEYGIPLARAWADGDWGVYGDNAHRRSGKFGREAGWFGHDDVELPDVHWDPGNFQWGRAFALAEKETPTPAWIPPIEPARLCACGSAPS